MRVIITSFTARCLENWLPLAEEIRRQGGKCDYALFPRVSDPNHRGLMALHDHVLLKEPIDGEFNFIQRQEDDVLSELASLARGYDAVLMASCVAGPELRLKAVLDRVSPGTLAMGLQHGFYQLWERYEAHRACFDLFGVFGEAFLERFSPEFKECVVALGLPKLDRIQHSVRQDPRAVLFALQSLVPVETVSTIAAGLSDQGFRVVLRPHPEHTQIYEALRGGGLEFSNVDEPIGQVLSRVGYVVTSGSTVALEALAAQVPTIVVPEQEGEAYSQFGIVANSSTASDIIALARQYENAEYWSAVMARLERHTGPLKDRAGHAYEALRQSISRPGPRSVTPQ